MAKFPQDIPFQNAPNFAGMTKPIPQPEVDKTFETIFKGIGNAFSTGVALGDEVVKEKISDQMYARLDAEQEGYTGELQGRNRLLQGIGGNPNYEESTGGDPELSSQSRVPQVLPPDSGVELPQDLKRVPRTLGALKNGADSGSIPKMYYNQRLLDYAKELRAQYPGYRKYIDEEISRISGIRPANAVINDLNAQYKSLTSSLQEPRNKALAILQPMVTTTKGANVVYRKVLNGTMTPEEGILWAGDASQDKIIANQTKNRLDTMEGQTKILGEQAESDFDDLVYRNTSSAITNLQVRLGTNGDPVKLMDVLQNPEFVKNPQNLLMVREAIAQAKIEAMNSNRTLASDPFGKSGRTFNSILKTDKVDAINKKNTALVFDELEKYVTDGNYSLANRSANFVKAATNNTELNLITNEHVGRAMMVSTAINNLTRGNPAMAAVVEKFLVESPASVIKNKMDFELGRVTTQTDWQRTGQYRTYKDSVTEIKANPKVTPSTVSQSAQSFVKHSGIISDPNASDVMKLGAVRAAYGYGNQGFVSLFNDSGYDPQGRYIKGKEDVFQELGADSKLREAYRLSQQYDPTIWPQTKSMMINTFQKELFGPDIAKINQVASYPGIRIIYDDLGLFRVEARPKLPGTTPEGAATSMPNQGNPAGFQEASRLAEKLNKAMAPLRTIADIEGTDAAVFPFQVLLSNKVDPTKVDGNIAEKFAAAIYAQKLKDKANTNLKSKKD